MNHYYEIQSELERWLNKTSMASTEEGAKQAEAYFRRTVARVTKAPRVEVTVWRLEEDPQIVLFRYLCFDGHALKNHGSFSINTRNWEISEPEKDLQIEETVITSKALLMENNKLRFVLGVHDPRVRRGTSIATVENYATTERIKKLLAITGESSWARIQGSRVRIRRDADGNVVSLGHVEKDLWL